MLITVFGVLLLLGGLWLFVRFALWPSFDLFARIIRLIWLSRGGLKPWTHQGRWRLLGSACFVAGVLLLLQAREAVHYWFIGRTNIDPTDWRQTGAGIATLTCGGLALALVSGLSSGFSFLGPITSALHS